jgi:Lsr2
VAKQIITNIIDDLDGSEANETVSFALDGMGFSVDLNLKNAKALRDFLEKYMEAGTRTGRVEGKHAQIHGYRPTTLQTTLNREQNQKIRAWAENNGWELSDRGRIPQVVVDAFDTKSPNPEWLAKQNAAKKVEDESKSGARAPRKAAKPVAKPEFVS